MTGSKRRRGRGHAADELYALSHPLRVELLRLYAGRGQTSPTQAAEQLGANLGNASYHVRILAELGLVKLARTRQRRGAVEHLYRLTDAGRRALARAAGPVRSVQLVIKDESVDGVYAFASAEDADRFHEAVEAHSPGSSFRSDVPLCDAEQTDQLVQTEREAVMPA